MIFVANSAFCQEKMTFRPENKWVGGNLLASSKQYHPKISLTTTIDLPGSEKKEKGFSFLAPDHYACNLGYFCKQEIRFEKATRIPLKFRLGSVEQCDWLEGKSNSTYLKQ